MTGRRTKTLEPSCRASSIAVAPRRELDLNMQVAHMDIKPENILVSPCGTLKLGDMGLAWPRRRGLVTEPLGTPLYMAPEIGEGLPYSGEAADVWSIGRHPSTSLPLIYHDRQAAAYGHSATLVPLPGAYEGAHEGWKVYLYAKCRVRAR